MRSVSDLKDYILKLQPSFMAKLFYYLLPHNRGVVQTNMQHAFGSNLTAPEYKKLIQAFYTHILKLAKELITMRFLTQDQIIKRVKVIGLEHNLKAFKKNKGVLWPVGHLGNWELTPLGARPQVINPAGDFQVYTIRKKIRHAFLEKVLFRQFEHAGIYIIPKEESLRPILRALSANNVVSIAFDQHVREGAKGILANFFGHSVGTYRVLAKLVKKTQAAVVPAAFYRLSDGSHVCEFYPEIEWISHDDTEEEIRLNTEAYNQFLEEAIWRHPEQWQWRYRRWR